VWFCLIARGGLSGWEHFERGTGRIGKRSGERWMR
jgi:hypothetical protein